ncbi:TPA: tail assembly protein [Enterobacter hormaechei]|jgi:predicted phage tail protein|uniref:tail assembly protein n=1 Tax=Enterobacteriaceae TaxID=543 RepID=UPI00058F5671|nr:MULTISPECIES: tail assembly protein [Enterobacteriaceae]MBT1845218.1 tail assembly protein [Enterobacter hormaechei subsp. xiangfangensis]DAG77862.1 MAG TPA: tail assembly protein [Caudoviricetes sp.]HBC8737154.1 tail assembly protein [Klebsiella oxytoca]HCX4679021.1 tail assembly protein [Escherichia coli]MBQ5149107.1 tail assembly protein [Citrobacter freundii]
MNTANHETMSTILLSGSLAKLFGRTHQRLIGPTREAFTALSATIPGFQKFMNTSKARGLTFAVFVDKKNVTQDDLDFPNGNRTIRIVPIIIGSKKAGILQTIMGAVLVAVGAIATFGFGQAWGVNVMVAGGSMIAGGVIQMLSPQPTGLASKQSADNKASYAFGGVTNTAAQGYPVPLLYGKRRIGGAIISAGIYVEDQL